jgi:DNA-binding MarR family transcriptional regulator
MSAGKGGIDMETGGLTVRGRVAEAFDLAATLHVRHLARGTSLTLKSLLAALDQNGPERLSTLATVTMVTQPVVSQLVGRLEREGLVIRRIDPTDARAMLVEITDAGRKLRGELRQSQHESGDVRGVAGARAPQPRHCSRSARRAGRDGVDWLIHDRRQLMG